MKVLVLGAGKMVTALLKGLKGHVDLSSWMIYSPSGTSALKLSELLGAQHVLNLDSIGTPDWILLGCKPQQLKELKKNLPKELTSTLYVSLLAALTEDDQKQILGVHKLIRLMPNLAVEYGQGVSLLSSKSCVQEMDTIYKLISPLGTAMIVSEDELTELTLLTGSGGAFIFAFCQALAGSFQSLTSTQREFLIKHVLCGASESALRSQDPLSKLISDISSKGGLTEAVLKSLREEDFEGVIKKGILSGVERGKSLRSLLQN